MVVRRKPKAADVEDFIQGGGTAPQVAETQVVVERSTKEGKVQSLKMRIPAELLAQIDAAVASRRPAPSRHQWILEAIYEKVARDEAG
jgi:hypothetical protein